MADMHEVSVALGLLDLVEEKCRETGYQTVSSVRVQVGKISGILPEALTFAFDSVKKERVTARDSELIIELIPLGGVCTACKQKFTTDEPYILECPSCSSSSFKINQGYELQLIELEVN